MGQFLGFAQLGSAFDILAQIRNGNTPANVDSGGGPNYRVYGPSGLMSNGSGTMTQKESGSITGATNASPIVITSAGHGLTTGAVVTISGVGGNTAANGTFTITKVDANTFSLNGSTGNGAYTSGGTWNTSGLYHVSLTPQASDGYVSGTTYYVYRTAIVSGTTYGGVDTFVVV